MGFYALGVPLGHKWSPTGKAHGSLETLQGANIPYQRTNSPAGRTYGPLGSGQSVPFWPACRRLSFNSLRQALTLSLGMG